MIYTETMQNQFDAPLKIIRMRQRITPNKSFWLSAQPSAIDLPNQRLQSIQLENHLNTRLHFYPPSAPFQLR